MSDPREAAPAGQVFDLMATLNASVAEAKKTRGESGGHADVHDMLTKKKPAAKKTTTQKTAAEKRTTTAARPKKAG
ncbi:hypothetical protein [Streptomyces sp. NPDC005805]|uniref:hypothetical protein n=1 Tax=Streptomyces sp. NPDC005805 TaxID=3157068 RepID=UPI0033D95C3B